MIERPTWLSIFDFIAIQGHCVLLLGEACGTENCQGDREVCRGASGVQLLLVVTVSFLAGTWPGWFLYFWTQKERISWR
ncbi:hypothetical protein CYMTET_3195 [Cymbomonas tetramitiformis]|uniref:Uncharacterized protein n=1 Tax=Cymbomonas tetramitiformis TaxID=36881 RepID=A0AAE0LLL9_9CHLO|nr:hypothetical protein CYMTET_3195 [Cymbomonas tetramitiformis]